MENRAKYSFESRFTTKKNLMSFAFLAESLDRRELCDIAACAVSPRFADEALGGFGANVRLLSTRSSLTLRIRRLACVASAITLSAHTDAKTRKQPVRAEESTTRVYSSTLMDGTDVYGVIKFISSDCAVFGHVQLFRTPPRSHVRSNRGERTRAIYEATNVLLLIINERFFLSEAVFFLRIACAGK
jgi:hypothetical protein